MVEVDNVYEIVTWFLHSKEMTHNQASWINARKGLPASAPSNNRLEDRDIYLTFKEILEIAKNFNV